jgi:hypothetical protein
MPFFSIIQESFPFLVLSDERRVLPWEYGRMFAMRLTSHYVRVTARGVQFSTSTPLSAMRRVEDLGWQSSSSCMPAPDAMCREGLGLVFFPDSVVDVPYDFAQIPANSVLDQFPNGSSCHRAQSRRELNPRDVQYEVSLCDLLDSNMDIILDCNSNQLHWRQDQTSVVEYFFISLMCVYLMSCISANVVKMSDPDGVRVTRSDAMVLLANLVYLMASFCWFDLRFIVTDHDLVLFWVLWVYVLVEALMITASGRDSAAAATLRERPLIGGISVYTAVLLLLTLRVHYTFDNPYLHILTAMFGTRTFLKTSRLRLAVDVHTLTVAYDAVCYCTLLAVGIGTAADSDFEAFLTQTMFVVISLLLATAIDLHGRA